MAPFQFGFVGEGSTNGCSNGPLLGLMGTPKILGGVRWECTLQLRDVQASKTSIWGGRAWTPPWGGSTSEYFVHVHGMH